MHEELYLPKNSPLRFLLFAVGILLLPFSFAEYVVTDGVSAFGFHFDPALFAEAALFCLPLFASPGEKPMRLAYPYFALTALEFLRFGTVTILGREIVFNFYIFSAFLMLCGVGFSFILLFIAMGKMRSKLSLYLWTALLTALAVVSLVYEIVPFYARDAIGEGEVRFGLSRVFSFFLSLLPGFFDALFLKDDLVKAEKSARKNKT